MATLIESSASFSVFYMRGGGLVFRRLTDNRELFIQPGDDAAIVRDMLDALDEIPDEKRADIFDMYISEYFA